MASMSRKPGHAGRRIFWSAVALATLLCGLGLLHTWTRVAVLDRSYKLARAREEGARLAREATKLKLEVATLEAAARVDREARGRLQMGPPAAERTVVLRAARSGDARPAAGKQAAADVVVQPAVPAVLAAAEP